MTIENKLGINELSPGIKKTLGYVELICGAVIASTANEILWQPIPSFINDYCSKYNTFENGLLLGLIAISSIPAIISFGLVLNGLENICNPYQEK